MKRRRKDSGFAMLLVFLLAACVAITLYMEVPRVAFQAERQRELLLVDRGNQFKRAIQVFVTDKTNNPTHRYPASLDELESLNGHRYLRHRYLDPMTGKDEWRLVHINGGILTDSVTTQAPNANGTSAQAGTSTTGPPTADFISQQPFLDPTGGTGAATGGVTRALNRRPGDTGAPPPPPDPNNPGSPIPGGPGNVGSSGVMGANGLPSSNGLPPGIPGVPNGNNNGMPVIPGMPGGFPGTTSNNPQQTQAASCFIGDCGASTATNQQANGQIPGQQPVAGGVPMGGMPQGGMPGFGTPGGATGNALSNQQSAAASMIGNLLTTPRPGGMPTNMQGTTVGGGLAGVASKYQAEGIMVINQRTKINEWEYIFDSTKYRAPPNPLTGPAPALPTGLPGNTGTPVGTMGTTPGASTPPAGTSQTIPPGGGGGGQ
jgi:hypothetical protein